MTALNKLMTRGVIIGTALLLVVALLWLRATFNYISEWQDPRSVWFAATSKSSDEEVSYSIGAHYLDVASQLGSTPRGTRLPVSAHKRLASLVRQSDQRIPALLA